MYIFTWVITWIKNEMSFMYRLSFRVLSGSNGRGQYWLLMVSEVDLNQSWQRASEPYAGLGFWTKQTVKRQRLAFLSWVWAFTWGCKSSYIPHLALLPHYKMMGMTDSITKYWSAWIQVLLGNSIPEVALTKGNTHTIYINSMCSKPLWVIVYWSWIVLIIFINFYDIFCS